MLGDKWSSSSSLRGIEEGGLKVLMLDLDAVGNFSYWLQPLP